jgi:hypothetical protein
VEFLSDSGHAAPSESVEPMSRRLRRSRTATFQGEGRACDYKGRSTAGSAGGAVRRRSKSDHIVEGTARGRGYGVFGAGIGRRHDSIDRDRREHARQQHCPERIAPLAPGPITRLARSGGSLPCGDTSGIEGRTGIGRTILEATLLTHLGNAVCIEQSRNRFFVNRGRLVVFRRYRNCRRR